MRIILATVLGLAGCTTTVYLRENNKENSTGVVAVRGYEWSHETGLNIKYWNRVDSVITRNCPDKSFEVLSTSIEPTHAGMDWWLPCLGACVFHTGSEEFRVRFRCKVSKPEEKATTPTY